MSKTIKFNLILNGNRVRNLEGLRENFSVEDILEYFDNGILEKWLKIREYTEECEAISKIDKSAELKEKIKSFVDIFAIDADDRDIDEAVYVLNYLTRNNQKNKEYAKNNKSRNEIISDYFKQYNEIICHMEKNKDDWEKLKADSIIVEMEFYDAFSNDLVTLAKRFYKESPKVLIALLSKPKLNACHQVKPIPKEFLPGFVFINSISEENIIKKIKIGTAEQTGSDLKNTLIVSAMNCKLNGICNGQKIEKNGESTEYTTFESVNIRPLTSGSTASVYYMEL